MKSILQQLYNGELDPVAQFRPKLEEHRKLSQQHLLHYEDFLHTLEKLTPPLHERFIKIMDEQLGETYFDTTEAFINDFCLGVRMMAEVYTNE